MSKHFLVSDYPSRIREKEKGSENGSKTTNLRCGGCTQKLHEDGILRNPQFPHVTCQILSIFGKKNEKIGCALICKGDRDASNK